MGLFSSGPEEHVRELIDGARGDSVTADKLTKADTGFGAWDRLHDGPLIDHLKDGEQPHYVITQQQKSGITVENGENVRPDGKYRTMMAVTDERVLFAVGGDSGDRVVAVDFDSVTGVKTTVNSKNAGPGRATFTLETDGKSYSFRGIMVDASVNVADTASDVDEITEAADYVSSKADVRDTTDVSREDGSSKADDRRPGSTAHLGADPQGEWITPDRVAKVAELLDDDEVVHYMWRGGTIDVEGSSAGDSLFGNDRDRKSSFKGIFTAVTDKRIVIAIPQYLGDDERHIPYHSITSVDLDTGLMARRVSLQTKGQTYHVQAQGPSKDELREAMRFIREKIEEIHKPQQVQVSNEADPTEQLKNLKELHDQGVLSDEEFEEKKQNLLDQI